MDIKELELENEKLKNIIKGLDLYREQKLRRAFGEIPNEELIQAVREKLFSDPNSASLIINACGTSFFNDDYASSILVHGSIIENYRFNLALLNEMVDINSLAESEVFVSTITKHSLMQIISMSECYEFMPFSHFYYCPVVGNMFSLASIIENRIEKHLDDENIIKEHNYPLLNTLLPYISEACNSLLSTILLFSHKSYSQAAVSMRGFIEQFIIIATLAHYPNTISKFMLHNELKVKEELGKGKYKKEIDDYLISQDINPTNMTLRSKYIDYGWMDSIDEFNSDKSKKMYKPKTMAKLIGLENYYEWYADLSNYVHSNFLYIKTDWNKFVNLQIARLLNVFEKLVDLYKWLTGYNFIYKGIDMIKYITDLDKMYTGIENKTLFNYDFMLEKK